MKSKWNRITTDVFTGIIALLFGALSYVILVDFVGVESGIAAVVLAVVIAVLFLMAQRWVEQSRYNRERSMLVDDLELKDILYSLLQKRAIDKTPEQFYTEILQAAIRALQEGEKGSIIDIRDRGSVKYVAVEGFDRRVLEKMGLGYKDTYLYKETGGAMDRTVVIRNSVNYNKLHSNDDLVDSLIAAGTAGVQSTICTPIRINDEIIGMLNIDSPHKHAFDEHDIAIIEIFALEVGKMINYYEALQENIYLSQYDAMTHIYNRGYFYELHRKQYNDGHGSPYIFVSMDIDNLKEVNDTMGHDVGDELIRKFVQGVKSGLPENAVFGRYGGDEFNIILPEKAVEEVEGIMKDISKYFEVNYFKVRDQKIHVAYSYGIISWPDEEKDYEQLIVKADKRMYSHKKARKELDKDEQQH